MINLGRLLSPKPIPIYHDILFHQPTIQDIMNMGENTYWGLLKIWDIDRRELIDAETKDTKLYNDFNLWKTVIFISSQMKSSLIKSVDLFLNTKVEFLPISNTIMIGEDDSQIELNEEFYNTMREIVQSMFNIDGSKKNDQYKETDNMSLREKQIIEKMKRSQEKLNKIKNGDTNLEDRLAKQIISLVAIGHYTFEEVYNMTMIQMIYLLKKYVEIQQYELYTSLSPYMDSKKNESPKHWVDT